METQITIEEIYKSLPVMTEDEVDSIFEEILNSLPTITDDEVERILQEVSPLDWWYTSTGTETQTIVYNTKYLPSDLVDECFVEGEHTFVNKSYTGNGFTYGTLNSTSAEGITVIVAPNQEVVKSKEASDKSNNDNTTTAYIYEKCEDVLDLERNKTVFIVADSFIHHLDAFLRWSDNIERILIDEAHQIAIQGSFRPNLRGFTDLVVDSFPKQAKVSVTATPMLFQKVDIELVREVKKELTDILITPNQERSLERLKMRLNEGKQVVLATQDVRIIKRLIAKGELRANFKVGTNLMRTVVEFFPSVKMDAESNLTIISSRGFEGFDIEGVQDVFIFEDRAKEFTTFFPQNTIQIIGRAREGVNYVEWCYLNNSNRRKMPNKESLQKQAESDRISFDKKMTDKNYVDVKRYYKAELNSENGLINNLVFNEDLFNLDNEKAECDFKGIKEQYESYFNKRDFNLIFLDEERYCFSVKGIKPSAKKMFQNVKTNKAIVEDLGLMDNITPDYYHKENLEQYLASYRTYIRRKFWDAPIMVFGSVGKELIIDSYAVNERAIRNAWMCEEILSKEDFIDKFVADVLKDKKRQKQDELGRKSKDYKEWLEEYSVNIKDRFIRLLIALSDTEYNIVEKNRNHRDYNILVEVSMDLIEDVSMGFYDTVVTEIDIRNANPRIIHALLNKKLSDGFYGEEGSKERLANKRKINKLLNSLSKEQALQYVKDDSKALKEKKSKLKSQLKGVGFCDEIADYLINEYWDKHKDALFNVCTFHEKNIIDDLMRQLRWDSDLFGADKRMVRRHDSIIVFGSYGGGFNRTVENFEYLGQKGWFKRLPKSAKNVKVVDLSNQSISVIARDEVPF